MPECTTCARAPYNKDSLVCQRCFDYTPLGKPVYKHWARALPTNAERFRAMSDEAIVEFLTSVFCAGMLAEERGDDFHHSFPWTLDRLRQPAKEENSGKT